MKALILVTSAAVIALIAGCAAQPDKANPQDLAAARTQAAESKSDKDMEEFLARYKEVDRAGSTVYCASVAPTGTRMQRTVCLSAREYAELREQSQELLRRAQSAPIVIPPPDNLYRGRPPGT